MYNIIFLYWKIFPDKQTKVPFKKVLTAVGFAHAPGLLRFFEDETRGFKIDPRIIISIPTSLIVVSWYNEQDSKRETNGGNRFECGTLRTWSAVQLWAKVTVVVLYDIVIVSIVTIRWAP